MRATTILALLVASAAATVSCDHPAATPNLDQGGARAVLEPVRLTSSQRVAAAGRVETWREADVASKLPGRIARYERDEGDRAAAGEPIVRLDDRELHARLRAAEARAREAGRTAERLRSLRLQGIVAASEVDRAEADLQASAAAVDEARVVADDAIVRAPFAGVIVRKFKEVGESVAASGQPEPLFRIADLSRLKVRAEVPERDIGAIRVGQTAEVVPEAYPDRCLAASVRLIGLEVGRKQLGGDDPRRRLHEKIVEVELELPESAPLRSGMTVDVYFPRAGAATCTGAAAPPASG